MPKQLDVKVESTALNTPTISTARRDWFDALGKQLQNTLESESGSRAFLNASPTSRQTLVSEAAKTGHGSLPKLALSVATRQTLSYAFPGLVLVSDDGAGAPAPPSSAALQAGIYPCKSLEAPCRESKELANLISRHSQVSHMVLTDSSYSVFMSSRKDVALCYKIHGNVAVVCGDPLCDPYLFNYVIQKFELECGLTSRNVAFLGMSETFREYAESRNWITVGFGVERIINPSTNPILSGACGKRIYAQSRQLLDPKRGGIKIGIYNPARGRNAQLESEMLDVYGGWRVEREQSGNTQSYLTVVDFSAYPGELFYLHAKDKEGRLHGFAGLRRLGAGRGYHLDPCIEATSATRGVSDLLVIASMALLKTLDVRSLSLGYEPSSDITTMTGTTKLSSRILRSLFQQTNQLLQLEGKTKFHDRFKPDDSQNNNLYLVFPATKLPRLQQLAAVTGIVHIDIQNMLKNGVSSWAKSRKNKPER